MKKVFLAAAFVLALASLSVFLTAASATVGGPVIVIDSGSAVCDPIYEGSPCFGPPNTGLHPGDSTTLLVTVQQQEDDLQDNATTTITWPAGALTFVSNDDSYSPCDPPTTSSVTCNYTDFGHTYKSDSFHFTVGPNDPGSVVTAHITTTTSSGSDSADATITMAGALSPVHAWVGLKNSDDQGTQFDLQAVLKHGSTTLATATATCVKGITRNPSLATEAILTWDHAAAISPGDTIVLSARIGTGPNCSGHSNATGLRFYYDATNRNSRFDQDGVDQFFHSTGSFNSTAPAGTTAATKDSPAVKLAGGNTFQPIGTWTAGP